MLKLGFKARFDKEPIQNGEISMNLLGNQDEAVLEFGPRFEYLKGEPYANFVLKLKDQNKVLSMMKRFETKLADNLPHAYKLMLDKSLNFEISIDEVVVLKGSQKDFMMEVQENEPPKKKEVVKEDDG